MRIIAYRCDLQPAVLSMHFADFCDVWLAMLDYLEAWLLIYHVHFHTNVPFLLEYNHGRIINIFFVEAAWCLHYYFPFYEDTKMRLAKDGRVWCLELRIC